MRNLLILSALFLSFITSPLLAGDQAQKILLKNGIVWSTDSNFKKADILILNGQIHKVGLINNDTAKDAKVIDMTGKYILPGLIDMHAHIYELGGSMNAPRPRDAIPTNYSMITRSMVASGITTARLHLTSPDYTPNKITGSNPSTPKGPSFDFAGKGLFGGIPNLTSFQVTGFKDENDLKAKIKEAKNSGATWLAIHYISNMNEASLKILESEAVKNNLKIMAAGDSMKDFKKAIEFGADTIEYMPKEALDDATINSLKASNIPVIPTLSRYYSYASSLAGKNPFNHGPYLAELGADTLAKMKKESIEYLKTESARVSPEDLKKLRSNFIKLHQAGIQLLIGSDAGSTSHFHHDAIWLEMNLWHKLGVSATDIISAVTINAAQALNNKKIGAIAEGNKADLVIYNHDLTNGNFNRDGVLKVIMGGQIIK